MSTELHTRLKPPFGSLGDEASCQRARMDIYSLLPHLQATGNKKHLLA